MANNVIEFSIAAKDEFSKVFDQFGDALDGNKGEALAVGAAFAALGVATAALIKATADAAEEQKLLADRAGATAEAFGLLSQAAKYANVDTGALSAGLKFLNKSLSESATGNRDMERTLKALGITAKDPTEAFKQAVKTFSSLEESAEKTALGVKVFGKAYTDLKPVLNAGTEALQESEEWARKAGTVFSDELAQAGDDVNDSFSMLGDVFIGIRNRAIGPLLPDLAKAGKALADTAVESNLAQLATKALHFTVDSLGKLFKAFIQITFTVGEVVAATFQSIGTIIGATLVAVMEASKGNFSTAVDIMKTGFSDAKAYSDKADAALNKLWATQEEAPKAAEPVKKSAKELTDELARQEAQEKANKKATDDAADAAKKSATEKQNQISEAVKLIAEIANENDKLSGNEEKNLKVAKALQTLTPEQQAFAQQLIDTNTQLKLNKDHADLVEKGNKALADAVKDLKDKSGEFADKQGLINTALQQGLISAGEAEAATYKLNKEVAAYLANDDTLRARGAGPLDAFSAKMNEIAAGLPTFSVAVGTALKDAAMAGIDGLGDALADWIVNGGSLKDALEQLGKRVAQQLISDIISAGIRSLIFDNAGAVAAGTAYGTAAMAVISGGSAAAGGAYGAAAGGGAAAAGGAGAGAGAAAGAGAGAGWAAAGTFAAAAAVLYLGYKNEALSGPVSDINKLLGLGGDVSAGLKERVEAQGMANLYKSFLASNDPDTAKKLFLGRAEGNVSAEKASAVMYAVDAGQLHGGMSYVPKESSYYLDAGERVLSPKQNTDLTTFLESANRGGGAIGNVTVNAEIHIMENATSIDQFAQLDRQTLRDKLGRPIIEALNEMSRSGFIPEFAK